jgi:hypothetical protein
MRSRAPLRGSRTQAAGHDAGHLAGGAPARLLQQADLFRGWLRSRARSAAAAAAAAIVLWILAVLGDELAVS